MVKKDYVFVVDGVIDFVVLFIFGESFYLAVIDEDFNLFDEVVKVGVIIIMLVMFLVLVKVVFYGWC